MQKILKAQSDHFAGIKNLLMACDLPAADIESENQNFFVITNDETVIASACVEVYGGEGIFRSFAVEKSFRNQGMGEKIYAQAIEFARTQGLKSLFLLTTTADDYFFRRGWIRVKRELVPEDLRKSSEFAEICPDTAVCMFLAIQPGVIKEAVSLFLDDLNCSQSVFTAFAPSFGIDKKSALKLTTGFGGGIAGRAGLCGAVSGAYMILGLKYGRADKTDLKAKKRTLEAIAEFDKQFIERNGSLNCKELLNADMSTSEGKQKLEETKAFEKLCPQFIKDAAEIVEQILEK